MSCTQYMSGFRFKDGRDHVKVILKKVQNFIQGSLILV